MKNLVMGFGKRAKRTAAAKTRQLAMLEKMKDYCEEEGVCRRYALTGYCLMFSFIFFRTRTRRPAFGVEITDRYGSCIIRAVLAVVVGAVIIASSLCSTEHIHTVHIYALGAVPDAST